MFKIRIKERKHHLNGQMTVKLTELKNNNFITANSIFIGET